MIGIMSKAWAERHGAVEVAPYTDTEIAYVEDHANGTGPFVLEAYEPGARTVLVRNTEWWGLAEEPHNIDRVVFTAIADPRDASPRCSRARSIFCTTRRSPSSDRLASAPGVQLEQTMEFGRSSSGSIRAARNYSSKPRARTPSLTCGSGRRSTRRSISRRSAPGSCAASPYLRAWSSSRG